MNGWSLSKFSDGGITHETFRKGSGPGVIVVHEIPGITPVVEKFANEVADAGFTVVMPPSENFESDQPFMIFKLNDQTSLWSADASYF